MCTDECGAVVERQRARVESNLHVTRMTRSAETGNKHKQVPPRCKCKLWLMMGEQNVTLLSCSFDAFAFATLACG